MSKQTTATATATPAGGYQNRPMDSIPWDVYLPARERLATPADVPADMRQPGYWAGTEQEQD